MKVNKNLLLLLSMGLLSPTALSIDRVDFGSLDYSSSETDSSRRTSISGGDITPNDASSNRLDDKQCREKIKENGMISMEELRILNGGTFPSMSAHSDTEFKLEFKKYASKCANLEVNRILDANNNHIVQFMNKKDYSASDLGIKDNDPDIAAYYTANIEEDEVKSFIAEVKKSEPNVTDADLKMKVYINSFSMKDKIGLCMKAKKYITVVNGRLTMDRNNTQFDYSRSLLKLQKKGRDGFDISKSSKLLFASPVSDNNSFVEYEDKMINDTNSDWACTKVQGYGVKKGESNNNFVFKSVEDKKWDFARIACESAKDGDIYAIKRLIDKDTGNRTELQQKIREVYSLLLTEGLDEKATEIRNDIAVQLKKLSKYSNIKKKKGRTYNKIKKELKSLFKQYQNEIVEPTKEVLARSIESYEELGDSDADSIKREAIETRVASLNETLEEFDEFASSEETGEGIEAMQRNGLTSLGKEFVRAASSSKFLSKVCLDCDEQLDIEDAEEEIEDRLKLFKTKDSGEWKNVAKSIRGSKTPMFFAKRKYESLASSRIKQHNSFVKREQERGQKACKVGFWGSLSNPTQCQQFKQGQYYRSRMNDSKMNSYQSKMDAQQANYNLYSAYLSEAQRAEQAGRGPASGASGSSIDFFNIRSSQQGMTDQSIMYNMGVDTSFASDLIRR
ncbi:hypothetical protein A9Q84_20570 [Halobacteriovorax marinus]|uniref:Uncharacterized protein n=1 Tax=Halobacteriovorax marinus TaxID=97084 RepID=A0A1Y5F190_9BACT|nr:hypothetical protein A9Q84_20570 [Halobacteriovorax marinus]